MFVFLFVLLCYVSQSSIEVKAVDSLQSSLYSYIYFPMIHVSFANFLWMMFFIPFLSYLKHQSELSSEFLRESTTFIATVNYIILGIK